MPPAKIGTTVFVKEFDPYADAEIVSAGIVVGHISEDDYPNDPNGYQASRDAGICIVTLFKQDGTTVTYPVRGVGDDGFAVGTYTTDNPDDANEAAPSVVSDGSTVAASPLPSTAGVPDAAAADTAAVNSDPNAVSAANPNGNAVPSQGA